MHQLTEAQKEEFTVRRREWNDADVNKDGKISLKEYVNEKIRRRHPITETFDKIQDIEIAGEEATEGVFTYAQW
jgi:hypothetical protein